jgi:hypothetical protein
MAVLRNIWRNMKDYKAKRSERETGKSEKVKDLTVSFSP